MIFWVVSSSALLLTLFGLRRVLRGRVSPALQYGLWALALLRLLIPGTAFATAFSLENLTERTQLAQDTAALRGFNSVGYRQDGGTITVTGYLFGDWMGDYPVPVVENATPEEYVRLKTTLALRALWTRVWLAGICAVGGVFLASNFSFARRLRRSRREVDIKQSILPVYVCEGLKTPCLFGLFRPAIYLTPEVAADAVKLRHVLAHETTHYRHGDNLWAALRGAALALHWYSPLVWLASAASRRDAEAACDAGAIRRLGEAERADYGRTLIGLTVKKAGRFDLLCCATTMTGSGKALKERINLIARNPRTRIAALAVVVAVAAAAAVCLFTGAKKEPAPEPMVGDLMKAVYPDGADEPAREGTVPALDTGTGIRAIERAAPAGAAPASGSDLAPDAEIASGPEELIAAADLLHSGAPQRIMLTEQRAGGQLYGAVLSVAGDDGATLWRDGLSTSHAGWRSYFLCEQGGRDYLLSYSPDMGTGNAFYQYELFDLADGEKRVIRSGGLEFAIGPPGALDLDGEAMADFADEINGLLAHSILLASTCGGVLAKGPASAEPYYERYAFLDDGADAAGYPEGPGLAEKIEFYEARLRSGRTVPAAEAEAARPGRETALREQGAAVNDAETALAAATDSSRQAAMSDEEKALAAARNATASWPKQMRFRDAEGIEETSVALNYAIDWEETARYRQYDADDRLYVVVIDARVHYSPEGVAEDELHRRELIVGPEIGPGDFYQARYEKPAPAF